MTKWFMRVYVGLIALYILYILGMAAVHTVCDCLR